MQSAFNARRFSWFKFETKDPFLIVFDELIDWPSQCLTGRLAVDQHSLCPGCIGYLDWETSVTCRPDYKALTKRHKSQTKGFTCT